MAVKTKNDQAAETPSERFERVMKKVMDRQRRAKARRDKQLSCASVSTTR